MQQAQMTFSILSGPELGISRWPLQTHTLPSASTCSVSWENAVWATPTGSLVWLGPSVGQKCSFSWKQSETYTERDRQVL